MFVTLEVSNEVSGWLKKLAWQNMSAMSVTFEVSKLSGWSNELAW